MTKKVYIPNRGVHNYADAERFGELVYVTSGRVSRTEVGSIYRAWIEALSDSQPDDMIVNAGLTTLNMIGAAIFARMHGRLNMLLFNPGRDGEPGHYLYREIDVDSLLDE